MSSITAAHKRLHIALDVLTPDSVFFLNLTAVTMPKYISIPAIGQLNPNTHLFLFISHFIKFQAVATLLPYSVSLLFFLCFSGNLLHSHTPCGRARERMLLAVTTKAI